MSLNSNNRVTIFIPSLARGGAERAMIIVANGLAQSLDVDLVVSNVRQGYIEEVNERVNLVDFKL